MNNRVEGVRGKNLFQSLAIADIRLVEGYRLARNFLYAAKTLKVTIAGVSGNVLTDLVTGKSVPFAKAGDGISFSISTGPMELKAYELK